MDLTKDLQGTFGDNAGSYDVNVDAQGKITAQATYSKDLVTGLNVSSTDSITLDLIVILRAAEPKINNAMFTMAVEMIARVLGK